MARFRKEFEDKDNTPIVFRRTALGVIFIGRIEYIGISHNKADENFYKERVWGGPLYRILDVYYISKYADKNKHHPGAKWIFDSTDIFTTKNKNRNNIKNIINYLFMWGV